MARAAPTKKHRRVPKEAAARYNQTEVLVGFVFWHDDHGVAFFAWLTWSAGCAGGAWSTWLAWSTGWAWYWHDDWRWRSDWHFNSRGHDGWCWVDGGFFASRQGGYSQQCGAQSGDFHGGFLL